MRCALCLGNTPAGRLLKLSWKAKGGENNMSFIPASLTWDAVATGIADFLGLGLVTTGLVTVIALRFAPQVTRAIKRVFGSR